MRHAIFVFMFFLVSCGGTLSDEQRKKLREEMQMHEIKRVSEAEITEAAFAKGRTLMSRVEKLENDPAALDSLVRAEKIRLHFLVPGASDAMVLEQQLIEAYIAAESGQQHDNVQMVKNSEGSTDSVLYTKPVIVRQPDGSGRLKGVWNLWLSRKQLILAMDK